MLSLDSILYTTSLPPFLQSFFISLRSFFPWPTLLTISIHFFLKNCFTFPVYCPKLVKPCHLLSCSFLWCSCSFYLAVSCFSPFPYTFLPSHAQNLYFSSSLSFSSMVSWSILFCVLYHILSSYLHQI